MIATREGPDIAVEVGKEFNDDGIGGLRNEIALGDFEFIFPERARFREKLIASTRGEDEKIRRTPFAFDGVTRFFAGGVDSDDMGTMHLAAGVLRAFEKQAIQNGARVNDDGIIHFQLGMLFVAGDQFDGVDKLFGIRIIEKKREALNRFMGEAAATRLLPGEMLVKDVNGVAGAGQLFATHRPGRTAADNYDFRHEFLSWPNKTWICARLKRREVSPKRKQQKV